MKTVFVDSSVLFTASSSPTGGSSKLFTLTLNLVTSKVVLTETERNIRKKLQHYHLKRFFMLVDKMGIADRVLNSILIKKAKKVIVEKDAVILAEAKQTRADFLVTLDTKHFLATSVAKFLKPQKALTPKILIQMTEK